MAIQLKAYQNAQNDLLDLIEEIKKNNPEKQDFLNELIVVTKKWAHQNAEHVFLEMKTKLSQFVPSSDLKSIEVLDRMERDAKVGVLLLVPQYLKGLLLTAALVTLAADQKELAEMLYNFCEKSVFGTLSLATGLFSLTTFYSSLIMWLKSAFTD